MLGLVVAAVGVSVLIFGPPYMSASDYSRLRECPADPIPNDGRCYSLVKGEVVAVGEPDGYLFIRFYDRLGAHEEQVLDASDAAAFRRGGDVSVKYWHDEVVGLQVPGTRVMASTFRDPAHSINWVLFASAMLALGLPSAVFAAAWRRRVGLIDAAQASAT